MEFDLNVKAVSGLMRALSSTSRLKIMLALEKNAMRLSRLDDIVGISEASLHSHLKILSSLGLVVKELHGQIAYYRLTDLGKETLKIVRKMEKIIT